MSRNHREQSLIEQRVSLLSIPTTAKIHRRSPSYRSIIRSKFRWTPGDEDRFEDALLGKGVCRDTGRFRGDWNEVAQEFINIINYEHDITITQMKQICRNKWSDDKKQKNIKQKVRFYRWMNSASGTKGAHLLILTL